MNYNKPPIINKLDKKDKPPQLIVDGKTAASTKNGLSEIEI